MSLFFVLLFWFVMAVSFIFMLMTPEPKRYEHEDDPELDALIKELLNKKIERKRHLNVVRKDPTDGQSDSKPSN
jgi:hypothetical protein